MGTLNQTTGLPTGLDRHFHVEDRLRNYPTPRDTLNTTLGIGKAVFPIGLANGHCDLTVEVWAG
jgi:hypothetical protein